jgi:iron(II)-dependent oxidoreductase
MACTGVTLNDQWSPLVQEFNGVEMVLVPAGCFQMGNNDSFLEEQPVHEICFDQPFWIDRTEVTVSQYAEFLNGQPTPIDDYSHWLSVWIVIGNAHIQLKQDGRIWYPLGDEANHPIENVTWFGANDYCTWRQANLPTEAEWEYAARGPESLLYPWGNKFDRFYIVRFEGRNPEVGSKPQGASWVGALDMSGSQFEWTSSLYRPYPYDASDGREISIDLDAVSHRVFRGCAWYHPEDFNDNLTAPARFDARPDYAAWYYGFRCTRPIE